MDTTETYIKMRLAAIPDLGIGCYPRLGLTSFSFTQHSKIYADAKGDFYVSKDNDELCQLERQDQLQEMVDPVVGYPNTLVTEFWEWFDECNGIDNDIAFTSMEQLWLAFVMKEKYNKVWDGEKWSNR